MAEVLIVGAGIGGLCAARAVQLAGHRATLIERNAQTAIGAGLALWPNAIRGLDRLGCGNSVRARAMNIDRVLILSLDGKLLSEVDMGTLARRAQAPMLLTERPALHELLADGLPTGRLGTVARVDGGEVTLAGGERLTADAVIGADGVGSAVRRYVAPESREVDTGYTAVRGIADHALGDGVAAEAWGHGELIGAAALPGRRTYWFYEAPSVEIDSDDPLAAVRRTHWPDPWPAIIDAARPEELLVHAIRTVTAVSSWRRGSVALLGDAAHAMEPNLGQGAAQSIEDAVALLDALRAHDDLAVALEAYAASRRSRATMIQRESSRAARLALSSHASARNLFVRATPDAVRSLVLRRLLGA